MTKKWITLIVGFLALTNLGTTPALAKSDILINTRYYKIYGDTGIELANQMYKAKPVGIRATTNYDIEWSTIRDTYVNRCEIHKIDTKLRIFYLYPKWVNRNEAPRSLRKSGIGSRNTLLHMRNSMAVLQKETSRLCIDKCCGFQPCQIAPFYKNG
jgi:predicted secreted Zn-dependent protease